MPSEASDPRWSPWFLVGFNDSVSSLVVVGGEVNAANGSCPEIQKSLVRAQAWTRLALYLRTVLSGLLLPLLIFMINMAGTRATFLNEVRKQSKFCIPYIKMLCVPAYILFISSQLP